MVAVGTIVDYLGGLLQPDTPSAVTAAVGRPVEDEAAGLAAFRRQFYRCLTRRADALFELVDAALCVDGPVDSLVGLSLVG